MNIVLFFDLAVSPDQLHLAWLNEMLVVISSEKLPIHAKVSMFLLLILPCRWSNYYGLFGSNSKKTDWVKQLLDSITDNQI